MMSDRLRIYGSPQLDLPNLVIGFSGWMDGGEVSTGCLECLVERLSAEPLAEIEGDDLYILSFPGSMEMSALFRPHVKVVDGLVTEHRGPRNVLYCAAASNLLLFVGREPNTHWSQYADSLFELCDRFSVTRIYFIGSVAGAVPHTREPRMYCSLSTAALKPEMQRMGVRFTNYEGPGSFVTYLTVEAARRKRAMISLVGEIPAYVQGRNARCIESVTRRLVGMLGLTVHLDDLRDLGDQLEEKITEVVQKRPELAERIGQLERDYDSEVFDTQMGDLKSWLESQGIQLD